MLFRKLYQKGMCIVLSEYYGLVEDDVLEALNLVDWDVDRFRDICDRCIWRLSLQSFRNRMVETA